MFRFLQKKNPHNILLRYKHYRNKVTNSISKTKQNYYRNQIDTNNRDTKNIVRELTGVKSRTKFVGSVKNDSDEVLTDYGDVAAEFNNEFAVMDRDLARRIETNQDHIARQHTVPN